MTDLKDGPLTGLRVLDMSRILAGPTVGQLLGDLGADVIKIERPGKGDDTRAWGPPFVKDKDGNDTQESAYYLCANRNKRSVAVDISNPEGQVLLADIAAGSDIMLENFKVGDLKRRGLDYETLKARNPGLIYCSITGFGQTGPYAHRAGYDFLIQSMGGIMSVTGDSDGEPTKVGVGIADVMTGMYSTVAVLSALHAREKTGEGQHIDVALLDSQISWLINMGTSYLTDNKVPGRMGNMHPTVVPYGAFEASDGWFSLAIGNDSQFAKFCDACGSDMASDPRFTTNRARVENREALMPRMFEATRSKTRGEWIKLLEEFGVPCGPINDLESAINDPHALGRGSRVKQDYPHAEKGYVETLGNPIKLSGTPITYRRPPPRVGQHTDEVLKELGFDPDDLKAKGAVK